MTTLPLPTFKEIAPMQENETDMLLNFNRERNVEVEETLNYGVDFSNLLAFLGQED